MQTAKKFQEILPDDISELLKSHYLSLMSSFYETQSAFLSGIYKRYQGIETASIILCFTRNIHLEIIRQREKNLNFNVSFENFVQNFNYISKPYEKITNIVQLTGIPKETVRRKVKNLLNSGYLLNEKGTKGYVCNIFTEKNSSFNDGITEEIRILSKFVIKLANHLDLNLSVKLIEKELNSHFSFYWYHYLSCQLEWLKMWQTKLKDNDLLLIVLQAVIPTLQYEEKNINNVNMDNIFKIIGKTKEVDNFPFKASVSATTVSDVTGIPRATCIRKLEKLVRLGFLLRENKLKRYYVNQSMENRTKNILTKDNVGYTIQLFSQYLAIILNSLVQNRK